MHTRCMFSLWKRSVNLGLWVELQDLGLKKVLLNLGPLVSSTIWASSMLILGCYGPEKLVAQIKYVFEILGSALITLVMALESSWVWIRPMAHDQAHQCWATCTVGSGPYEAKNHPKAGSLVGPTHPILAHPSPVISPHSHVWILPTSSSYDAMKLGVSIKAWGRPLIRHSFKAVRVMGPKKCVEFGHPRITWTTIGTSARDL